MRIHRCHSGASRSDEPGIQSQSQSSGFQVHAIGANARHSAPGVPRNNDF
jgi:hypothetical protein